MRKMLLKLAFVVPLCFSACVIASRPSGGYYSAPTTPPPEPQYENPGQQYGRTWVRGRWNWNNGQYQWESGYWVDNRQGSYWNDGYWEQRGNEWYWVDGQWGSQPPTIVNDHSTPPPYQPPPQQYPQQQPGPVVVRPNPQPPPPQPPPPQPQPMGRPVIYTVNPAFGSGGTQVRIQGDFFSPEDYVSFGTVRLRTVSQSRTHFDVLIPMGLPAGQSYPLVVNSNRGQAASQQSFNITP